MDRSLELHYRTIVKALGRGQVVPFLGAGANRCGCPEGVPWQADQQEFLPSGNELASHLVECFDCPSAPDLARVSQFVDVLSGSGPLYDKLHDVFDRNYPLTPLHRFLAKLPSLLRSRGCPCHFQLIITTNYDDLLERAFEEAGEAIDVVSYIADGEHRGKFLHRPPDEEVRRIERPNEYRGLDLKERPVILKIHGAIDRSDPDHDSFVITEDHYIDYLTRTNISNLVPVTLAARLRQSHLLFLGYALSDWNLRVILHRISGEQRLKYKSWAIQMCPDELDQRLWTKRDVEILDVDLSEYIAFLDQRLEGLEVAEVAR